MAIAASVGSRADVFAADRCRAGSYRPAALKTLIAKLRICGDECSKNTFSSNIVLDNCALAFAERIGNLSLDSRIRVRGQLLDCGQYARIVEHSFGQPYSVANDFWMVGLESVKYIVRRECV